VSDPDVQPLARLQEPDSQDRYHNYWRRFICYLLRVWESKREYGEERRDGGESNDDESDDDKLNGGRGRDLNTPDDLDNDDDREHEEIVTPDTGPIDTLKDGRRLVILTSH
jgi:hypothetical protein